MSYYDQHTEAGSDLSHPGLVVTLLSKYVVIGRQW